ncbi:MAG: histidine phosphatase family protein [Ruminococcaceae bacterium]|jgi:2,3-bisphosphoglycerate-dependent phosphoglycerate mutase|nr:histidine phosphatase family protein [Oscillospiraceae bacterium]
MQLLIIRHGESEADILNVHEGRADFPLTPRGHRQAEAMAAYVAGHYRVARIYHSTLTRARQTAEHLAEAARCPLIPCDELMEFNNGLLAGLSREEADEKYPEVPDLPLDQAMYGMESKLAFRERAERALARILEETGEDETVAVVSHGGMINQLCHAFLRLPIADGCVFATGDTGVHVWFVRGEKRVILTANRTEHADHL